MLVNTSLATTGRFRCEVSTEAPMFSTESKYGDLLVVSLPTKPPVILGGRLHYNPGDFLHLNCSSHESKPAADLAWFINDEKVNCPASHSLELVHVQVDGGHVITHPISLNTQTGLYSSRSDLLMTLTAAHFTETGELSVRCEASIGRNYNTSNNDTMYSK